MKTQAVTWERFANTSERTMLSGHPLGVREDFALTSEQLTMLKAIEAYDFWYVTERLRKKHLLPDDLIEDAVYEFKRYVALIGLGYRKLTITSKAVDEVWHAAILFTAEYRKFCVTTVGSFIHHSPNTSRKPRNPAYQDNLINAYDAVFGTLPEIWVKEKAHRDSDLNGYNDGYSLDDCDDCEEACDCVEE